MIRPAAIAIIIIMIVLSGPVYSQVSLAPTILTIHDNTNIGSIYINNTSNEPKEVAISLKFGYPGSDSLGNIVMKYDDSEAEKNYGLNDQLRVFPRMFILGPGQQQTVRFQVLPDRERPDGTYWTRAVIASNTAAAEPDEPETDTIVTRISYRFEQNIPVFYRKGETNTGIEIDDISVEKQGSKLAVKPTFIRTGNSPFLGTITLDLVNNENRIVTSKSFTTTSYFRENRRFDIDTSGLDRGSYQLNVQLETRRRDMASQNIVRGQQVTKSLAVEI